MAFMPQTPQRPIPGLFINTPAVSKFAPPPPVFRTSSLSGQQPPPQQQQSSNTQQQQQQSSSPRQDSQSRALQPIQRAARTINEVLQKEANFPDLDSYVRRE